MAQTHLRTKIAEHVGSPLRILARGLAEGLYSGSHRATTKGAGIEFAGHRPYTPGDDLRHLDRHAQLRHNRLLVRQFQTDTERSIHLVCDVSLSMAYSDAPLEQPSKLDLSLLLTASLAYLTRRSGDDLGLSLVDADDSITVFAKGRNSSLEQIMSLLEARVRPPLRPSSTSSPQERKSVTFPDQWETTLSYLGSSLRRGSIVLILSDFLDLTPSIAQSIAQLGTRSRTVRCAQILTPNEAVFPFDGVLRFIDPESGTIIQADAKTAAPLYRRALDDLTEPLSGRLQASGGRFVRVLSNTAPDQALSVLAQGLPWGGE